MAQCRLKISKSILLRHNFCLTAMTRTQVRRPFFGAQHWRQGVTSFTVPICAIGIRLGAAAIVWSVSVE